MCSMPLGGLKITNNRYTVHIEVKGKTVNHTELLLTQVSTIDALSPKLEQHTQITRTAQ